jgi:hypothetical protein
MSGTIRRNIISTGGGREKIRETNELQSLSLR